MLVLTRREWERIIIADKDGVKFIEITVADIRGGSVKLGIEAPRELAVHREEVFERIQRRKK